MRSRLLTAAAVTLTLTSSAAFAQGGNKPARTTKCSSIMAVCQQRAQGQVAICEDMYRAALSKGYWQATEEPDGTKHPQVPCTR